MSDADITNRKVANSDDAAAMRMFPP